MGKQILIIGAGGGGLAAAITAADAGGSVRIVEAAEKPGGSTAMSAGVIYAADTSVQRAAGIEGDSVEAQIEYYMAVTQWLLEPQLVRALCEGTHDLIPWLESLGIVFPPEGMHAGGADKIKRSHLPAPGETDLGPAGGAAIAQALLDEVEKRNIEVRTGAHVADLILDGGAVAGARLDDDEELRADAVIITTGGIGHNRELLARYWPDAAAHTEGIYLGAPTVRGDGLVLGEEAGAEIIQENQGVLIPTPGFDERPDAFYASYLVFVNEHGARFANEQAPYAVLPDAMQLQPGAHCWAILDHTGFSGAGDDPALADPYGYGVGMASNWESATLAAQLEAGKVKSGETLGELAETIGVDADGLVNTMERYNADVAAGHDSLFEKQPPFLPIDKPPFYAVELKASTVGLSFTGLRIDVDGRVLAANGKAIPGLFAAGETTGGLQAVRYVASGAGVGNALVFGRRAGTAAAA